jgi:hypothetical protein
MLHFFLVLKTDHKSKNEDEMEVDYLLKWVQQTFGGK